MRIKVPAACAAVMAAALTLGACGSATVESTDDPTDTKVAPLERSAAPTSDAASSSAASETASSSASASRAPASEISAIPTPEQSQGPEREFIAAVQKAGVNTDGAEDQIIGAGQAACREGDAVTIPAVAGQLIEQGRATLPHEELTAVLTDQARGTLCAN